MLLEIKNASVTKKFARRRYLGKIKGVELEFLRLFKGHDLDVEGPGWVVAIGNGIEQVSNGVVRVGGGQSLRLLH